MNCDDCKYYQWYYEHCNKWDAKMNPYSVCNCFEERMKPIKDAMINGVKREDEDN